MLEMLNQIEQNFIDIEKTQGETNVKVFELSKRLDIF